MIIYDYFKSETEIDNEVILTYGLSVIRNGVIMRRSEDVTHRKSAIKTLVNTLNDFGVDPIHLDEVLDNFLQDFASF